MDDFDGNNKGENQGNEDEKPKERYIPPEPTENEDELFGNAIPSGINFDQYEQIDVVVSGEDFAQPITTFEEANLRTLVLDNLKKSGYTKLTPIQKHAFPNIVLGRDIMACAQTGSGKTAAFLVPIINQMLADPRELVCSDSAEPHAVIVSPVRELADQIYNEARKFSRGSIIKCGIAYGGTALGHQLRRIMEGVHILVGTPGRLNDFAEKGRISFASCRFFILDEADRMLDMGFLPQVEKMLKHSTMNQEGRQTLMFSATFPDEIQNLAANYLNNYLFIAVGIVGGACTDVQQTFYECSKFAKKEKLYEILGDDPTNIPRTLIFVEAKRQADFIASRVAEKGLPTTSIHGDRLQSQRETALRDFKSGSKSILVATGVAARGLDIKNVEHVINYDLPNSIDEYVHRIGRTGRLGNKGRATSFYDPSIDNRVAADLVKILTQAGQAIPDCLSGSGGGGESGFDAGASFGARDTRDTRDGGRGQGGRGERGRGGGERGRGGGGRGRGGGGRGRDGGSRDDSAPQTDEQWDDNSTEPQAEAEADGEKENW